MLAALKDVTFDQWVALLTPILGILLAWLKVKNTKLAGGLQAVADVIEASSKDRDTLKAEAMQEAKEVIAEATKGTKVEAVVHRAAKAAEAKVRP